MTLGPIFDLLPRIFIQGQVTLGAAMRVAFFRSVLTAASLGFAMAGGALPAAAADLGLITKGPNSIGSCTEIVFTCDNGRQYPLCPIAVSVVGEVVTASLQTGHRGGTHVRMIPMGVGYRYAGRGVWLDGFRDNALLNFGKHSQIACTIQRS